MLLTIFEYKSRNILNKLFSSLAIYCLELPSVDIENNLHTHTYLHNWALQSLRANFSHDLCLLSRELLTKATKVVKESNEILFRLTFSDSFLKRSRSLLDSLLAF